MDESGSSAAVEESARTECLRFVKVSERARTPTRGSSMAAGVDLYAAVDVKIPPCGKAVVNTDLKIAVPFGTYGRIAPRSGLTVNHFIDVGAGVVDADYRGVLGVVLFNHASVAYQVKQGDRIAQLICEKIVYPILREVKTLETTTRDETGFGSTGLH